MTDSISPISHKHILLMYIYTYAVKTCTRRLSYLCVVGADVDVVIWRRPCKMWLTSDRLLRRLLCRLSIDNQLLVDNSPPLLVDHGVDCCRIRPLIDSTTIIGMAWKRCNDSCSWEWIRQTSYRKWDLIQNLIIFNQNYNCHWWNNN